MKIPQNHFLGILNLLNTNLASKNATWPTWGSTRRFFWKFQICPLTLKLGWMGFPDMRSTNIKIKILYDVLLRVYTSIFWKNRNLSQYLKIGYSGVSRRQEPEFGLKNHSIKKWGSTFQKKNKFRPLTLQLGVSPYFKVLG